MTTNELENLAWHKYRNCCAQHALDIEKLKQQQFEIEEALFTEWNELSKQLDNE